MAFVFSLKWHMDLGPVLQSSYHLTPIFTYSPSPPAGGTVAGWIVHRMEGKSLPILPVLEANNSSICQSWHNIIYTV